MQCIIEVRNYPYGIFHPWALWGWSPVAGKIIVLWADVSPMWYVLYPCAIAFLVFGLFAPTAPIGLHDAYPTHRFGHIASAATSATFVAQPEERVSPFCKPGCFFRQLHNPKLNLLSPREDNGIPSYPAAAGRNEGCNYILCTYAYLSLSLSLYI